MLNSEIGYAEFEQVYAPRKTEKIIKNRKIHLPAMRVRVNANVVRCQANRKNGGNMNIRNEIKSYIVREGLGSAGIPLPYNNVKIVDSDFKDLTYNQPGRLFISSPCLMLGYYGRNDLTKQALHTDENGVTWYDTKDYAYVDENGCLFVLDRYNPPAEIIVDNHKEEANLLDIVERIKADRCIKICKLMGYNGHLILHLVIDEFLNISETDAIESIISTIKTALPEKYYPDIIHILKSLPRTSVGKVDYPKLKKDTESIYRENNNIVGKLNVVID